MTQNNYKKLGTTKTDAVREIETWMGSEGNPQIAEIIFDKLYDSDIIESNELGYYLNESSEECWFSDLWEEVDNKTKKIHILLDTEKYNEQDMMMHLKLEFEDEFIFEVEDREGSCIALDYAISSFDNEFEAEKALQRINNVLEYAEF